MLEYVFRNPRRLLIRCIPQRTDNIYTFIYTCRKNVLSLLFLVGNLLAFGASTLKLVYQNVSYVPHIVIVAYIDFNSNCSSLR